MDKKCILVAGGAGYIGSHTTVELIEAGYNVVIADNFSNSHQSVIDRVSTIVGFRVTCIDVDCCDKLAMEALFQKFTFDAVIHFAAYKAVGESVNEPIKYYRNNINSLLTVLELMRDYGVKNLLFSSSCTVYGEPDSLPVDESTPRKSAESPYGYTKQASEDIIEQCVTLGEWLSAIALRYFNPIGAHRSALIGELPLGVPANLIPYITQTAAGIRKELSVYGDDYNTPDGTAIRDYIDVVDLARAHVAAVNRMMGGNQKARYEIFNVGTGRGCSVMEIIKGFEEATGVQLPYRIVERRSGDIEKIYADTSLAEKELQWRAEHTLGDTLLSAWKWQQTL